MMKKLLSVCCLVLSLFLIGNVSASAANYVYTLDVEIPDPDAFGEKEFMIAGLEFITSGGEFGTDWQVTLGDAVPSDTGNWEFENFGNWNFLFDYFDDTLNDYAPLQEGNIFTITSTTKLAFSSLSFADYKNRDVNPQHFLTDGFVETAVPVPGSILLLGSGLIGLFGLARRKG